MCVCAAVFGVISSCDVGWYIFRLICSRDTFFLRCVCICVSAINAISLAFTPNHWWAALYICTSLAFDAYGTHTQTYTIIRIPCVISFYVHSLNMGMMYIESVRWKVVVASAIAAFVVVSIDGLNLVKRQSNDSVAISATACYILMRMLCVPVCGASDS